MRIGLDYNGVISCNENAWIDLFNRLNNCEFYIVSHCIADWDYNMRDSFHKRCPSNVINLTFISDPNNEKFIRDEKHRLVKEHNIDLYIDDEIERANHITCCRSVAIPPEEWQSGIDLILDLNK